MSPPTDCRLALEECCSSPSFANMYNRPMSPLIADSRISAIPLDTEPLAGTAGGLFAIYVASNDDTMIDIAASLALQLAFTLHLNKVRMHYAEIASTGIITNMEYRFSDTLAQEVINMPHFVTAANSQGFFSDVILWEIMTEIEFSRITQTAASSLRHWTKQLDSIMGLRKLVRSKSLRASESSEQLMLYLKCRYLSMRFVLQYEDIVSNVLKENGLLK